MSSHPRARSDGVVIEELGDELVIYVEATRTAHALSEDPAAVWRCCDGQRSAIDIASLLGLHEARVAQALDELSGAGLIEGPDAISRRALYKRVAKLGAAAVSAPLIYSVAVRPASAAASQTCGPLLGAFCIVSYDNGNCDPGPRLLHGELGVGWLHLSEPRGLSRECRRRDCARRNLHVTIASRSNVPDPRSLSVTANSVAL